MEVEDRLDSKHQLTNHCSIPRSLPSYVTFGMNHDLVVFIDSYFSSIPGNVSCVINKQ